MSACILVQASVNLAGSIQIGHKYIIIYFPIAPHVCHDDGVERGIKEHAVADNKFSSHFSANQAYGFVGRIPHRHDTSGLASFRTAETRVCRVCLGIFVYQSQIEEQSVNNHLRIFVCCSLNHQKSLPYCTSLFNRWLYACDVLYRIAFCEIIIPSTFEADIFSFYLNPSTIQIA